MGNAVFTWLHTVASTIMTGLVMWHIGLNWHGINQ